MTMMNLAARIEEKTPFFATIIDDAFEVNPSPRDLVDADFDAFATGLEDELSALEQLSELIGENLQPGDVHNYFHDAEFIKTLWGAKESAAELGELCRGLFNQYQVAQSERLSSLASLIRTLEGSGITVERLGRAGVSSFSLQSKVIFVDYYLENGQTPAELDERLRSIRRRIESIPAGERPALILMSSRDVGLDEQKDFRYKSNVLAGQFRFVAKGRLREAGVEVLVHEVLDHLQLVSHVDLLVSGWSELVRSSIEGFERDIRSLDIPDYYALQRLRLDEEGVSLGTYLLWVYTQYFQSVLERNEKVREIFSKISSVDLSASPPVALSPSAELSQIYQNLVFTSIRGDCQPIGKPHSVDQSGLAQFSLGDIFITQPLPPRYEDIIGCVPMLLVTPECDLVRPKPWQTVILLSGQFRRKEQVVWPVDPEEFELFVFNGEEFVIKWNYNSVISETIASLSGKIFNGELLHVSRMRSIYALKQQRRMAAQMTRVGTEVPLHEYVPFVADLYFRTEGKKCAFSLRLSSSEGGVYIQYGKSKSQVIFMPDAVDRILECAEAEGVTQETKSALISVSFMRELRKGVLLDGGAKSLELNGGSVILKMTSSPPAQLDKQLRVQINLYRG
ncbi:hypothetical protein [Pseudomonas aeruginosa]|uniref:hypothetical protein n=1 Tax=Pseudomonas aeruginosa TaxID=287 RepID=UPI002457845F|nr:hypothetical protein [Pseudomonas aeruginosa]MDH4697553.1 hypothetical protein [Pseudomonas aeruginosa]